MILTATTQIELDAALKLALIPEEAVIEVDGSPDMLMHARDTRGLHLRVKGNTALVVEGRFSLSVSDSARVWVHSEGPVEASGDSVVCLYSNSPVYTYQNARCIILFQEGHEVEAETEAAVPDQSECRGRHKTQDAPVTEVEYELAEWWRSLAESEIDELLSKMTEYGGLSRATDLIEIGRDLVAAGVSAGVLPGADQVQEGWLQELGAYFYIRGKFARWQAAIVEGRPVSDDTLKDIGVYVRMVQRIRACGGWPV